MARDISGWLSIPAADRAVLLTPEIGEMMQVQEDLHVLGRRGDADVPENDTEHDAVTARMKGVVQRFTPEQTRVWSEYDSYLDVAAGLAAAKRAPAVVVSDPDDIALRERAEILRKPTSSGMPRVPPFDRQPVTR